MLIIERICPDCNESYEFSDIDEECSAYSFYNGYICPECRKLNAEGLSGDETRDHVLNCIRNSGL